MAAEKNYGGLLVAVNPDGEEAAWLRADMFSIEEMIEQMQEWKKTNSLRKIRIRAKENPKFSPPAMPQPGEILVFVRCDHSEVCDAIALPKEINCGSIEKLAPALLRVVARAVRVAEETKDAPF